MTPIFAERRRRVIESIRPGVLVVPSMPTALRNSDVEHPYRQDSDFYYLTGFDEPESVLVLSSESQQPFVLFVRDRDPERETWEGARAGVEGAMQRFGADWAYSSRAVDEKLGSLLKNQPRLYYALGVDRAFDDRVLAALSRLRRGVRRGDRWPTEIIEPSTVLGPMRLVKSPVELAAMRRAVQITVDGHLAAMKAARPGLWEYELEALLLAKFRAAGSERVAYSSIVASGQNATVLHYTRNQCQLLAGDLVLIDAGAEYDYYAADLTRTFPVSGRFSPAQREIYEIVLQAQLASIESVKVGATLEDVHRACVRLITQGLVDVGLVEGPVSLAIARERYKPFYMHKTSHYLGMDVHDAGSYFEGGTARPLEPGNVVTVEPGIYVSAGSSSVYRGVGVRIEDDVVVTPEGQEVLSTSLPKSIEEVEALCERGSV